MPNPRSATIAALAAETLAASGVDVRADTASQRLALARTLATRAKCHISTAKRHMARAICKIRHPDYVAPQHGGKREGAGRPSGKRP